MIKHTQILICIHIIIMSGAYASIDSIKGAFGITFDDVIDPNNSSCEVQNGEHMCGIKPPKPYIAFDKYHVALTSRNTIYKISGTRELNSIAEVENCEKEAAEIILLVSLDDFIM